MMNEVDVLSEIYEAIAVLDASIWALVAVLTIIAAIALWDLFNKL